MTLQNALTRLTTLARETGADMLANIQLEEIGATLIVHWTGAEADAMPRETNLYFGTEGDETDVFLWAFAIDPHLYLWAVNEGVDDQGATDSSTRMIESVEAVENYLLGRPYEHYVPPDKEVKQRGNRKSLDT